MSEKRKEDIKSLIHYLSKDIEILNEGLQKKGILPSYKKEGFHIDYELFIELVKKYCYKDHIKKRKVPLSVVGKNNEVELIEIEITEVPDDRITLVNSLLLDEFDERKNIVIYSAIENFTEPKNIEEFFYKLLYALFFEHFKNPESDLELFFHELLKQWRIALNENKMTLIIKLPILGIRKSDNLRTFNSIFKIEEYFPQILSVAYNGLARSSSPIPTTFITLKTEISIDIHQSEAFGELHPNEYYQKYSEEYRAEVNKLYLFTCVLYLYGIEFKWQNPFVILPWWFEPKKKIENKHYQNIHDFKILTKEIYNQANSTYLRIYNCELYKRNKILIDSYFRFFQHEEINTYFLIDAFTFFEGMFTKGSKNYIKLRLRLNTSSLFAQSLSEFWDLADFFGILYDIRSLAVHGEDWSIKFENYFKENDESMTDVVFIEKIKNFREKLIHYMNRSLLDLIEKSSSQTDILLEINKDPLYYFNNSLFINANDNRNQILNKIETNYKKQKVKVSNKWEEIKKFYKL